MAAGVGLTSDRRAALSSVWRAFWLSRLLVWGAGMIAVLVFGADAYRELTPGATDPGDSLADLLLSPALRWDSNWFLTVTLHGYDDPQPWRTAFFPLYPLTVRAVGEPIDLLGLFDGHEYELAGILVSLAAMLAGLYLLHRLTAVELGPRAADNTVLLFAFFPTSFYLSAIYSEALFFALTVGCIYAGRMGWWGRAALLGVLAAATRSQGVLLIVPLAIMLLWGPRADRKPETVSVAWWRPKYRPRLREAVAVAAIPLGTLAYMAYIRATTRFGLTAPFKAHEHWHREFAGPLTGVWGGVKAGGTATGDLLKGSPLNEPVSAVRSGLTNLTALTFGLIGTAGAFRRLPIAYGSYALVAMIFAISFPPPGDALKSLPRLVIVVFPIFMWAGSALSRARRRTPVLAVSAAGLAAFSAAFASGYWIA